MVEFMLNFNSCNSFFWAQILQKNLSQKSLAFLGDKLTPESFLDGTF